MKIRITDLQKKAATRPEGYLETVLSKGTVVGEFLEIDNQSYTELFRQYNPPNVTVPTVKSGCCGKPKPITPTFPSVTTQLLNVTKAATRVINNVVLGEPIVSTKDMIDSRQEICNGCEKFTNGRCTVCGCFLRYKIQLSTEHCPLGHW